MGKDFRCVWFCKDFLQLPAHAQGLSQCSPPESVQSTCATHGGETRSQCKVSANGRARRHRQQHVVFTKQTLFMLNASNNYLSTNVVNLSEIRILTACNIHSFDHIKPTAHLLLDNVDVVVEIGHPRRQSQGTLQL